MHNSPETKVIQHRMEEVRCDLDEDVQEIVEGARAMGEWCTYVRTYPWVCLGTALAVGYLIVPRRRLEMQPVAQKLAELADQSRLLATSCMPPKGTVRGLLWGFVGNLVMQGVSSYVGLQAGKLFGTQAIKSPQDDRP